MLPKKYRLDKSYFQLISNKGRVVATPLFLLSFYKEEGKSKFGFIVSKKVSGKAVVRNKVKRKLKKAVMVHIKNIHGVKMVVVAKKKSVDASQDEFDKQLEKSLITAKLIKAG